MRYEKTVQLKNSLPCRIRAAEEADGAAVLEALLEVKRETDFLVGYPEECTLTAESEGAFLKSKAESPGEVQPSQSAAPPFSRQKSSIFPTPHCGNDRYML